MSKIGYLGSDALGNEHPALSQPTEQDEYCKLCGAAMTWEDCGACEDGALDEHDEDPINEPPGSYTPCGQCDGFGGWWVCPNAGPTHGARS